MNFAAILLAPVAEAPPALDVARASAGGRRRVIRGVRAVLLGLAAIFFALHFVHLRADFPNHSMWMDWAKYTDEGWYGDAAIRHYQLGHWNVPGDFNPAAALPVWPTVEMALFRVTGVNVVAARALTVTVFGACLVCCYLLIRRWCVVDGEGEYSLSSIAPGAAVLLLAVSPFVFVFMRMAILEPMLILLTLVALLGASAAGAAAWHGDSVKEMMRDRKNLPGAARGVALGLLLSLMVLTKTTAVFLFPAVFWMLFGACGFQVKAFVRVALIACAGAAVAWGVYYGLYVRPHYLADYKYLFSANAYTGATFATLGTVLHDAVLDGVWIGLTLFVLSLAAVAGTLAACWRKRCRSNPLATALLLWILGYGTFLVYHANFQPRYYLVLAVPLTMLVAVAFGGVLEGAAKKDRPAMRVLGLRVVAVAMAAALVWSAVHGAIRTVSFVRHPEYTFLRAVHHLRDEIKREQGAHPGHSPLVLSISGSDMSLMVGLPSICDDFGTMELADRVAAYKPGWFAAWNDIEDDKMAALAPRYTVVRVAAYPAYDDPERNQLILYRLDPVDSPGRSRAQGRKRYLSVPSRVRSKVATQPVGKQPEH